MLRGDGSVRLAVRLVLLPCVLTFPVLGCASTGALTSASPPAPMTPGAVMTNTEWRFLKNGEWERKTGEWIHLPAADAANLFLWIEQAERR